MNTKYRLLEKIERPLGIHATLHEDIHDELLLVLSDYPNVALTCSEIMTGLGEANTWKNFDCIASHLYRLFLCGFIDMYRLAWMPNGENEFQTVGYIRRAHSPQPLRRFEAYAPQLEEWS